MSSEKEISVGDAKIHLVFDLGLNSLWKGTYLAETLRRIERNWQYLKDSERNMVRKNVLRKG